MQEAFNLPAALADLLIACAFVVVLWRPLGRTLLSRIGADLQSRDFWTCAAVGMGLWGLCVLLLGSIGLLYRWMLLTTAGLLWAAAWVLRPKSDIDGISELPDLPLGLPDRILSFGIAGLSAVFLGIGLASSLAPELSFDALNVHLPYARDSAAAHRTAFEPNNWSSAMPALPLMGYVTAFVFSGVTLAKLFSLTCYLAAGGVVYSFAARMWGRSHAGVATLLFLSCPVAIYEATTALIDLPLTLYSAVAVLALLEWVMSGRQAPLWLSAVALGLGLGCKYHAVFWLPPILLVVFWHVWMVERPRASHAMLRALGYAMIVFVVASPWLLRAWWYTGNPVFPLANGWFQSPYFPPSMEAAAKAMYDNEGVGRSPVALALLPWTVTFNPAPFRGTLGILFLPGLVLAIFRTRDRMLRHALSVAGFYFYAWALSAQEIRYLLPLVPVLALLAAVGFLGKPRSLYPLPAAPGAPRGNLAARSGTAVVLVGALMSLPSIYPLWARGWTYWHAYQSPLRYLLGRQTAMDYLGRDIPSIHVYDYINRNLALPSRVLLLNDASQFYSTVPTLYSFTVEGERILLQEKEEDVLAKLRESRISHVLLNYNGIAPLPGVAQRKGVYFFLDPGFQERFLETVFSRNNVALYRFRQ
ncbi:MAG: glycosyltransferase family 39 protein [Acidobacteria bacterium]|nr:glycosyltransferase family 39 protein [Acidobacteriota bacterium]